MQWALLTVETWCNEVGLSVNPDKTEPVAFTRKRKLPGFFEPHIFGVTLSLSRLVKYLEVILDSQLTWIEHVGIKMRKAHNQLWACRRACGVRQGLRSRVVHWLCVTIIRLSVSYAPVWWPSCQTASAKKRLSRIQRCVCLEITGSICTTPTGAVEALHWPPSTGSSDTSWSKISSASPLESGVLVLPSPQSRT
jgi:hypothetical protein